MKDENKKVLLHTCCAVCSGYPIKHLRDLGYEPVTYFFNPNIYSEAEHQKRLDAQIKLCKALDCELIVEDYAPELYKEVMVGYEEYEEGSERCKRCFELRLLKTVQKAQELGIVHYTTSITISPHKNFNVVSQVGSFFSKYFNIDFMAVDFKKQDGFLKTMKLAKELNLYRQDHCGCENSLKRLTKKEKEVIEELAKEIKKSNEEIKFIKGNH